MTGILITAVRIIGIIILAPLTGGLLTGLDRVISAKMQRRKGPPLLQPFYDVLKLLQKEATTVNEITRFYITFTLFFNIFTVVLFCMGADILLCIFSFTLGAIFFVIAGYSSYSPYSLIGAERELIQIMCYEPMVLMTAFGYYMATGTFSIASVFSQASPAIIQLPLIFLGLTYILTIKLRKSPFDMSMSHHGHQEIVKGITTELTGICLAMLEVSHWYETIFALGLVYIFFVYANPVSWLLTIPVCLLIYFFEIVTDNSFARTKWKNALTISWAFTAIVGGVNLLILSVAK